MVLDMRDMWEELGDFGLHHLAVSWRAPQESQSWRSSNASPDLQPRRHGDAWGRRRKSAPGFRVADIEEGRSGTGQHCSSGRDTEAEGETIRQREKERDAEPDHAEETERSANPGHQGREREEKTEEPPREETEDATARHGPGGSWLDKKQTSAYPPHLPAATLFVFFRGNLPPGYRNTPSGKEKKGKK
ncbi:hypothetical protein NDU88_003266 [Pleurodeles waltl]|uniref:Uncharacterized protein n=1 Tax=Pleurodeles waltl TaxID=8319 RepID=A0AAV7UC08_PLEWA|nr:hypothetical protein NDU88_003266 [Pleurodeles waltl]